MAGAPESQLQNTLGLLTANQVYVPWEGVFFDNMSGVEIEPRVAFKRLLEEVLAGEFAVVGAFMPERLFRNAADGRKIRDRFRAAGIELLYIGKTGGDQRSPYAWHAEAMQDLNAELMARQTGYAIGTALEAKSASGDPMGRLPEAYEVAERMPMFLGHQGRPLSWRLVQPLASIIAQAKDRYLGGESFTDLARWSAGTELAGRTPAGSTMNAWWWRATLQNPKYAGLQMPTKYQGFRPGVGPTKKRPRLTVESTLVPSKLPALWSADDYYAIRKAGTARMFAPKARKTYRTYLLGGVAVDATCGHGMTVHSKKEDGRFWMICRKLDVTGRHSQVIRADIAEAELDDLFAGISLDDPELRRQVEEELHELAAIESGQRERFTPDPKIASMRQAVFALSAAGASEMLVDAQRRISELEASDDARRDSFAAPILEFRRAAEALGRWASVWKDADLDLKNQLLREAGVRAILGPAAEDPDGPAHVLAVAAGNPVFELALATSLSSQATGLTFEGSALPSTSNVHARIHLESRFAGIAERLLQGVPIASAVPPPEGGRRRSRRINTRSDDGSRKSRAA
jgi:hypothetical protein